MRPVVFIATARQTPAVIVNRLQMTPMLKSVKPPPTYFGFSPTTQRSCGPASVMDRLIAKPCSVPLQDDHITKRETACCEPQ